MKHLAKNKHRLIIFLIVFLLTIFHYSTPTNLPLLHDLYRRLYYLPIIYAAFVFGLKGSVITALIISLVYLPHIFHRWGNISLQTYDALFEITLYLVIANITGKLVEMERKRSIELAEIKEELAKQVSKTFRPAKKSKLVETKGTVKLHFDLMIGESPAMKNIYETIDKISDKDINVLILGDSGTGKELVAKALHLKSTRREKSFVAINCAAIPDSLLESELFGYKKGAFTGADQDKPGKFELANGGTLFLDEIAIMSLDLQAKLLRVLENMEIQPLGSNESIKADVRLISATNEDIEDNVKRKKFRADLFYRLNVVKVEISPLNKRKEDIPPLVKYFIEKYSSKNTVITEDTLKILQGHDWPGNVRELENVIQRAVALNQGELVLPKDLPEDLTSNKINISGLKLEFPEEGIKIEELEKKLLQVALQKTGGNQTKAAKQLGLTRPAFLYRLEKYDLK